MPQLGAYYTNRDRSMFLVQAWLTVWTGDVGRAPLRAPLVSRTGVLNLACNASKILELTIEIVVYV